MRTTTASKMERRLMFILLALVVVWLEDTQIAVGVEGRRHTNKQKHTSRHSINDFVRKVNDSLAMKLKMNGTCVGNTNTEKLGKLCGFEVNRGAEPLPLFGPNKFAKEWYDVCIKFKGFQQDDGSNVARCSKVYCFDLRQSTTFWCLAIGVPFSLVIALIVLFWFCCHFAYYCCCCCLFHKPIPKFMNKFGNQVVPTSNQVAPAELGTKAVEQSQAGLADTEKPKPGLAEPKPSPEPTSLPAAEQGKPEATKPTPELAKVPPEPAKAPVEPAKAPPEPAKEPPEPAKTPTEPAKPPPESVTKPEPASDKAPAGSEPATDAGSPAAEVEKATKKAPTKKKAK